MRKYALVIAAGIALVAAAIPAKAAPAAPGKGLQYTAHDNGLAHARPSSLVS